MRKVLIGFVVAVQLMFFTGVAYLFIPQPELGRHLTLGHLNTMLDHYNKEGIHISINVQPTMEVRKLSVRSTMGYIDVYITAGTLNQYRTVDKLEQDINKGIFEETHSV
jgi:hypothetical protein